MKTYKLIEKQIIDKHLHSIDSNNCIDSGDSDVNNNVNNNVNNSSAIGINSDNDNDVIMNDDTGYNLDSALNSNDDSADNKNFLNNAYNNEVNIKNLQKLSLNTSTITPISSPTSNFLLKIIRKKKIIDGKEHKIFTAKVVGKVPTTYNFRQLADFSTTDTTPYQQMNDLYNSITSSDINLAAKSMRNFSLPNKSHELKATDERVKNNRMNPTQANAIPLGLPPPPVFFKSTIFQNYFYDQHPTLQVSTGVNKSNNETYERLINKQRAKIEYSVNIPFDHYPIPTEALPEANKLTSNFRIDLLNKLVNLFKDRPVWTRAALLNQFTPHEARMILNSKQSLAKISYTFTTGPFADCLCKLGYDPREDPSARKYQRIITRTNPKSASNKKNQQQQSQQSQIDYALHNDQSHIFDGTKLISDVGTNFQLCDIHDPDLRKLIDDPQNHISHCDVSR